MDKPNNPKCDKCCVIKNSLRCWNCRYKTPAWEAEHITSALIINDFDMFKSKEESERQMDSNDVINISYTLDTQMSETVDDFIFEYISPWCEGIVQHKVSKKMLERALLEYQANHPEEFTVKGEINE